MTPSWPTSRQRPPPFGGHGHAARHPRAVHRLGRAHPPPLAINAGEPIAEDDDLHGASAPIPKRLESAAPTDGILVSDVVKRAVAGKDFTFTDQGKVGLKGFAEPVRAWAVAWESA